MSGTYVIKRLLYMLLNLVFIITLVFFLFRLLPGNPADLLISPFVAGPDVRAALIERLGLDQPLYVQYLRYFGDILRGDLGASFFQNVPVTTIVFRDFMNTLVLVVAVFLISYITGSLLGALLAWRRGSFVEKMGSSVALFVRGAPTFWVGMLLILLFAVNLGWLPSGGLRSANFGNRDLLSVYTSVDFLKHLALPVLAGSIYATGLPLLLMRNTMLEVVHSDYLDLARAKGLSEAKVLYKHAFRNALMPLVAESSQFLGWAVGGMVAVEFVFSWPGLGREIVTAVSARDYPLAQGAFIYIAVLVLVIYFLADLIATYLDPRARTEAAPE